MIKKPLKSKTAPKTAKAPRTKPVRAGDPAAHDARTVRFGTGCISPSLRK